MLIFVLNLPKLLVYEKNSFYLSAAPDCFNQHVGTDKKHQS